MEKNAKMVIMWGLLVSIMVATGFLVNTAFAQLYENSPNRYENNLYNYNNSSSNYNNNPNNYENNLNNYSSNRIIRNESGNATGYAVPRSDGGVNYFDTNGNRTGYQSSRK